MMRRRAHAILTTLALVLPACGGSGSTGLITAESALLAEVRETGTCREANGTTYCFADVREGFEGGPPGVPSPAPSLPVEFDTTDIEVGTACAVATRDAGGTWTVGEARAAGDDVSYAIAPTVAVEDGGTEAALLCFDPPPGELPDMTDTLADLGPSIIYVAPVI